MGVGGVATQQDTIPPTHLNTHWVDRQQVVRDDPDMAIITRPSQVSQVDNETGMGRGGSRGGETTGHFTQRWVRGEGSA